MASKRLPPDDPREWLRRARSNLTLARAIIPDVCLEDLCFDAQQAAGKAIKAVCIHRGVRFPYVHNLKKLLEVLEQSGVKIPKYMWESQELSPYAVETRYPGLVDPIMKREHRRAVRIAEAVLRWARARSESHDPQGWVGIPIPGWAARRPPGLWDDLLPRPARRCRGTG